MRILLVLCGWALLAATALSAEPAPPGQESTELGKVAASMKAGSWAELKAEGYNDELLLVKRATRGESQIYSFTHDAAWDPKGLKFLFVVGGHYAWHKFVIYSAETNRWTLMPTPPRLQGKNEQGGAACHAHDTNAIDPHRGIFFYKDPKKAQFMSYDIAADKYGELPGCASGSVNNHHCARDSDYERLVSMPGVNDPFVQTLTRSKS